VGNALAHSSGAVTGVTGVVVAALTNSKKKERVVMPL
jgi:hypothetical protein